LLVWLCQGFTIEKEELQTEAVSGGEDNADDGDIKREM
jgi:hypothetical protein